MDTNYVVTVGLAYEGGVWESRSIFMSGEDISHACEKALKYFNGCLQTVHSWIISCEEW
jgi:hypothetical protein